MRIRFIVDECIGPGVSNWLRTLGHQVLDVSADMSGMDDRTILDIAERERMIVITKYKDFGRMVYRDRMKHNGIDCSGMVMQLRMR